MVVRAVSLMTVFRAQAASSRLYPVIAEIARLHQESTQEGAAAIVPRVKPVVHRAPQILLAAKVTFRGLRRCLTEQVTRVIIVRSHTGISGYN
jgi:hypothetical protein